MKTYTLHTYKKPIATFNYSDACDFDREFESLLNSSENTNHLLLENIEVVQINLSNLDLKHCRFNNCTFKHCNFTGTHFDYSEIHNCTFVHCNFTGTSITNTNLYQTEFKHNKLIGTNFTQSTFWLVKFPFEGFENVNFTLTTHKETNFWNAYFKDCDFRKMNGFPGSNYENITISGGYICKYLEPLFKTSRQINIKESLPLYDMH